MSTTREEAMDLLSRMPPEVTWDDIMYQLYVRRKIEEGSKAADEERVVSHEDVKKLFARE